MILSVTSALCAAEFSGSVRLVYGGLEAEFTRAGLDALWFRDRHVFGDPHSDPRPAVWPALLDKQWKPVAQPEAVTAKAVDCEAGTDRARISLGGEMREREDGPGRWKWTQVWEIGADGKCLWRWTVTQLAPPATQIGYHRLCFVCNREEVFVEYPNKDKNTPGRKIPVVTRGGEQLAPQFGVGELVRDPAEFRLPFAGSEVVVSLSANAKRVEFWNAWWRQQANIELPIPTDTVTAEVQIDLSQLSLDGRRFAVEPIVPPAQPWLRADIPPLPKPARRLRLGQGAPSIIAWGEVRSHSDEDLERTFSELAPYFDILELPIAWTDWRHDLGWDKDAGARQHAEAIAAEAQKEIRIAHKHGIKLAVSLNFGESGPGTGKLETRRQPQFQGGVFDPVAGTFSKSRDQFDWANAEAVAYARTAWRDAARLLRGVDYLFYNEPLYRLKPWYQAPFFSEAALADFRRHCSDSAARFPAKPYVKETDRTNPNAAAADWDRWYDWLSSVYARMVQVQAQAFAEANADNPGYRGTIWFQNVDWVGREYATDLEKIAALPEVNYLVAEYVTRADAPQWRRFKYHATKHNKPLSSFVNIGWYDPPKPGRVRYEGADDAFEAACRLGVDERAAMISLYPTEGLQLSSPAYHKERTAIWRRVTGG
jgi:hypothetical protein